MCTCSRAVRGSATPDFANTYFVNPEQSKPSRGVLPPQTYLTPAYESPVRSTRAAAGDGVGEFGIRRRAGVVRPEFVVVVDDGMLAMTVARTVSGDTPRLADVQPAIERRDTAAIAPTRVGEGVIMQTANADLAPKRSPIEKRLPCNLLAEPCRESEAVRRPTTKTTQRRKRGHIASSGIPRAID